MEEVKSNGELIRDYYLIEYQNFLMDLKFLALVSLIIFLMVLGLYVIDFMIRLAIVRSCDLSKLKFKSKFASSEREFKLKYLKRGFKGYRVEIKKTSEDVVSQIILHGKDNKSIIIAK